VLVALAEKFKLPVVAVGVGEGIDDLRPFEARALLRRAASESPGSKGIVAHPAVIAVLEHHPAWLDALARQLGGNIGLRADPSLTMSGGYAENV